MDTNKIQAENQEEGEVSTTSCSKYVKDDNATFLENLKGQMDEFVNASMEEHKACFKHNMDKIFEEVSKAVSAVKNVEVNQVCQKVVSAVKNVEVNQVNQTADST
ncbi:unnamed protein product [Microthlaspi erraticum]|uniref:Uncharacterized protein n=1 Tax=Microthlaspi erraticum TaxID=1685480 RepID=A0A6D2JSV3_9BRAS|nr:unnamed protein product [Microthlaspi erraticum]